MNSPNFGYYLALICVVLSCVCLFMVFVLGWLLVPALMILTWIIVALGPFYGS